LEPFETLDSSTTEKIVKYLKAIGFWRCQECPIVWPHPKELIGTWGNGEKKRVAEYLQSGVRINEQLGYGEPRFSDIEDVTKLGCGEQTDGEWVWPESLPFYVLNYDVKIPQELVAKALEGSVDSNFDGNTEYNYDHWNSWCQRKRRNRLLAVLAKIVLRLRK
jgi:hypothetical protein